MNTPENATVEAAATPAVIGRWRFRRLTLVMLGGIVLIVVAVTAVEIAYKGTAQYRDAVIRLHPAGYWQLGETSGTRGRDEVTGKYDATFHNVGLGVAGPIAHNTTTAPSFNGLNSFIDLGDKWNFPGTSPFTLVAWVKPTLVTNQFQRIFSDETRTAARTGYAVWLNRTPSGVILGFERMLDYTSKGGVQDSVTAHVHIPGTAYALVAAVFDGRRLRLFVNEELVAQSIPAIPLGLPNSKSSLYLGRFTGAAESAFEGAIAQVAIFRSGLSLLELQELYTAAK
jgi:hypothetical protein